MKFPAGARDCSCLQSIHVSSGRGTTLLLSGYLGLFPGRGGAAKWTGHEADPTPPSITKDTNARNDTLTPPL